MKISFIIKYFCGCNISGKFSVSTKKNALNISNIYVTGQLRHLLFKFASIIKNTT